MNENGEWIENFREKKKKKHSGGKLFSSCNFF